MPVMTTQTYFWINYAIYASRERVFRAWTEPDAVGRWYDDAPLGVSRDRPACAARVLHRRGGRPRDRDPLDGRRPHGRDLRGGGARGRSGGRRASAGASCSTGWPIRSATPAGTPAASGPGSPGASRSASRPAGPRRDRRPQVVVAHQQRQARGDLVVGDVRLGAAEHAVGDPAVDPVEQARQRRRGPARTASSRARWSRARMRMIAGASGLTSGRGRIRREPSR